VAVLSRRTALVASCVGLASVLACDASDPAPLTWTIGLEPGADATRLASVVAEIRRGGCDPAAGVLYRESFVEMPADMPPPPPSLNPGAYGLAAFGLDTTCEVFSFGCTEVTLPREGAPVRVELVALEVDSRYTYCEECVDGQCGVLPDAGLIGDGAVPDVGTPDGARDSSAVPDSAPPDSSAPDAGPCGENGQPCCAGNTCDASLECSTSTPRTCRPAGPCASTTCADCRSESGCGWCLDTMSCHLGDERGPQRGGTGPECSEWVFPPSICACFSRGTPCSSTAECCGPRASCRAREGGSSPFCCNNAGTGIIPCTDSSECCGYQRCDDFALRCVCQGLTGPCSHDEDCCDGPCSGGVCTL
jgi:hypothetical protein